MMNKYNDETFQGEINFHSNRCSILAGRFSRQQSIPMKWTEQ